MKKSIRQNISQQQYHKNFFSKNINNDLLGPVSPSRYNSPVYSHYGSSSNLSQTFNYPSALPMNQQTNGNICNTQNGTPQMNQSSQNGYHHNNINNTHVQHQYDKSTNEFHSSTNSNNNHNKNINHHNRRLSFTASQLQPQFQTASNQNQSRLHHQHSLPSSNQLLVKEDLTITKKSILSPKFENSLEKLKEQMILLKLNEPVSEVKACSNSVNDKIHSHMNNLSPVYEREKLIETLKREEEFIKFKEEIYPSQPNKTLSDLVQPITKYRNRSDYYKDFVVAIDKLYPDCKWPLHNTWTFPYIKHDNSIKNWSDRIKHFMDVSYVEDFWSVANYLFDMNGLTAGGDLTCFKKGIKPEWEDDQNRSGGSWLYQMSHQSHTKIEDLWKETLLGLIGDNFCDQELAEQLDTKYEEHKERHICDFISGTILMHRGKNEKISLWTKNYKDDHTTRLIG